MFDLEPSIMEWRRQMLAAGIKTPAPLEELENHLREEVEQQVQLGLSPGNAFDHAIQKMGRASALKIEFKKIERKNMTRRLTILTGVFILLLGTGMILPSLGRHHQRTQAPLFGSEFYTGGWTASEAYGLAWGIPLVLLGTGASFFGSKKRKA